MSTKSNLTTHIAARTLGKVYWATDGAMLAEHIRKARRKDILVTRNRAWLRSAFAQEIRRGTIGRHHRLPKLLVTVSLRDEERAVYGAVSDQVVDRGPDTVLLKMGELRAVLEAENRDELFIGARYLPASNLVLLFRGTLQPVLIPADWFEKDSRLDFSKIEILDHGQTIRIGAYEIAADAVLYDFDIEYRRRAKTRLIEDTRGIGGSIRRLRKQRGLKQEDFEGISRRQIGRIERGEIAIPHSRTLSRIAETLDVHPDELETY